MNLAVAASEKSALILRGLLPGGEPSDGELSDDEVQTKEKGSIKKKQRTMAKKNTKPRSPSAYNIFASETIAQLKQTDNDIEGGPPKREAGYFMKVVGRRWNAISNESKERYILRAQRLKADMDDTATWHTAANAGRLQTENATDGLTDDDDDEILDAAEDDDLADVSE